MTKNIHTTITEDIWKLGVANDIPWNKALKTGILALSGGNKEKKELEEDIGRMEVKIIALKERLKDIESEDKKKEEQDKGRTVYSDEGVPHGIYQR